MKRRILEHFGPQPLDPPRDFEQRTKVSAYEKPLGLWVSARGELDWLEWCKEERFGLDRMACRQVVHLSPTANLLWITGVDELDGFQAEFGSGSEEEDFLRFGIAWSRVAQSYDGIIIAPYIWERRLARNMLWYYRWDCASGCIWKASAISHFEQIEPPELGAVE